ncbi:MULTISPECIES: hypothetical protein [Flavobacteriaceae]|uniref:hypothetical protein n=1 Tax=Flavobacteriaceae TaxID=49546 RepID=UPI001490E256|nr:MULTISPECIES: hypothetical protein [Allomuricauda]MDC6367214.1 hypothetical protein [Muricauda sp. AC10]
MTESYIQYAAGYQKDNVDLSDIEKAIKDIQEMDEEHGAFWVSMITDDENVIETNKDLTLSFIIDGEESKFKASDWTEVKELYESLLNKDFEQIKTKIK